MHSGAYEALSSTRGDGLHTNSMQLHNNVTSITRNLWTACGRRSDNNPAQEPFDAICISQQDIHHHAVVVETGLDPSGGGSSEGGASFVRRESLWIL
jgi:hypothetical protein